MSSKHTRVATERLAKIYSDRIDDLRLRYIDDGHLIKTLIHGPLMLTST